MAGLFKPSKVKTTQSTETKLPDWMSNQLQANSEKANDLSARPFQAWDGPSYTGITADQQTAMAGTTGLTAFQPTNIGVNGSMQSVQAGDTIGQMGGLGALGIEGKDLSGYMNPFTQQVIDAAYADIDHQTGQSMTAAQGTAAKAGAFGGDRAAIEQAELASAGNRTKATTGAGLRLQGYQNAQQLAETDIGRQLGAVQVQNAAKLQADTSNQATGTQWAGMDLAAQQSNQSAGIAGANIRQTANSNLFTQGEVDRQAQEAGRTFDYQEFLRQLNDPYNKLSYANGITAGDAPLFAQQNTTNVAPGPSGFSTILGMGSLITGGIGMMGKANGGIVEGFASGGSADDSWLDVLDPPRTTTSAGIPAGVRQPEPWQAVLDPQQAPEVVDISHLPPAARAAIEKLAGGGSNVPMPERATPQVPMAQARPQQPQGIAAAPAQEPGPYQEPPPEEPLPLPGTGARPAQEPGPEQIPPATGIATRPAQEPGPQQAAPQQAAPGQRTYQTPANLPVIGGAPANAPIPVDGDQLRGRNGEQQGIGMVPVDGDQLRGRNGEQQGAGMVPAAVPTQEAAGIAVQSATNAAAAGEAAGLEEGINDRPAARRRLAELQAQRDSGKGNEGKGDSRGTDRANLQASTPGPTSFEQRLTARESGGKSDAQNPAGYTGAAQFGAARLQDLGVYSPAEGENLRKNEWRGRLNIPGHPNVRTIEDFKKSPEAQATVMRQHIARIDKAIDATPGAETMNRDGLRAVAHLGGERGMRRYVESGGRYNPADSNGTHLSDYYRQFAGSDEPPAGLARRGNPPGAPAANGPAGTNQAASPPEAVPASGIATGAGPGGPAAAVPGREAPANPDAARTEPQGWQERLSSRLTDERYAGSRFLMATGAGILGSQKPGMAPLGDGIAAGLKSAEHDALRKDKKLDRSLSREAQRLEHTERREDRNVQREIAQATRAEARADRLARQAEADGRAQEAAQYRREALEHRAENDRLMRLQGEERIALAKAEADRRREEGEQREQGRRDEAERRRTEGQDRSETRRAEHGRRVQADADDAERDSRSTLTALAEKGRPTGPDGFSKLPLSSEQQEQIRQQSLEETAMRHRESRQARTWAGRALPEAQYRLLRDMTPQQLAAEMDKRQTPPAMRERIEAILDIRRRAEAPNGR